MLIKVNNFNDYVKYFSKHAAIIHDEDNISVAVYPSEEYKFVFLANGINLYEGGSVLTNITNNIVSRFTDRLKKSYKKLTTSNVKNRLGFIVVLRNQKNLNFSGGQTKSSLASTATELKLPSLNYINIAEVLFKNTHIKTPIIELVKVLAEMEKRAALKGMKKTTKERVPKFLKATKEQVNTFLCEGDSALSLIASAFLRSNNSFFPLLGKPINSRKATASSLTSNKVIKSLVNVLGMNLSNKSIDDIECQNVIISTDSDEGGAQIFILLATFIHDYAPELIKQGRLKKLTLPLLTLHDKKTGEMKHWFKDFPSFSKWKENNNSEKYKTVFYKGLGKFEAQQVKELVNNFGIEAFLEVMEYSDNLDTMLENYMGKETNFRKERFTREDAVLDIGLM